MKKESSIYPTEMAPSAPRTKLGGAHKFNPPPQKNAHNFGYAAHRRASSARLSGSGAAHRVGKRGA